MDTIEQTFLCIIHSGGVSYEVIEKKSLVLKNSFQGFFDLVGYGLPVFVLSPVLIGGRVPADRNGYEVVFVVTFQM